MSYFNLLQVGMTVIIEPNKSKTRFTSAGFLFNNKNHFNSLKLNTSKTVGLTKNQAAKFNLPVLQENVQFE